MYLLEAVTMCALRVRSEVVAMEEFLLNRTGKVPLKFTGTRVANVSGADIKSDWDKRWHDISIYRTAKGRWIVMISYRANEKYRKEPPHDLVEVFDDAESMESFLTHDYDPVRNMLGYPPKPAYAEFQRQEEIGRAHV